VHLFIKQDNRIVSKFQFSKGPILIGRLEKCQVILPDKAVSKQHAVISSTQEGRWLVEDLGSTNKTYLNEEVIHKSEIKNGDCLRVACFTIEIHVENDGGNDKSTGFRNRGAVLFRRAQTPRTKPAHGQRIVVGKPKSNLNVFLSIIAGIIIGLIATLILKFMGGRFF
jgi:pSer/pThr/pTyr-binding forkhead associated (FHA) protein